MREFEHYDIKNYTTMRTSCVVDHFYVPESTDELLGLLPFLQGTKHYLLAGGSNVLFPRRYKGSVVWLMEFNKEIQIHGQEVYAGASVRIQKLINAMKGQGLGGIEYLFSLPCSVGGAVYMNAGRGDRLHSISQFVQSVEAFDLRHRTIVSVPIDDCQFAYRESVFQKRRWLVILGANLTFPKQEPDVTAARILLKGSISQKRT